MFLRSLTFESTYKRFVDLCTNDSGAVNRNDEQEHCAGVRSAALATRKSSARNPVAVVHQEVPARAPSSASEDVKVTAVEHSPSAAVPSIIEQEPSHHSAATADACMPAPDFVPDDPLLVVHTIHLQSSPGTPKQPEASIRFALRYATPFDLTLHLTEEERTPLHYAFAAARDGPVHIYSHTHLRTHPLTDATGSLVHHWSDGHLSRSYPIEHSISRWSVMCG